MPSRRGVFLTVLITVLVLLHGLPWWLLVLAPQWPVAWQVTGTGLAVFTLIGFPIAMWRGHGRAHRDRAAILGDTWLGVV